MPKLEVLLNKIIRPSVRATGSYHVPPADGLVKLDAMENPYLLDADLQAELGRRLGAVALNRYPVPSYTELKARICAQFGVPDGYDVVLGNGSDELISMISVACARPGAVVLAPAPAFVMYGISAGLAGLEFVGVPLQDDFSLNMPAMLAAITRHQPAVLYLPYPNNPTGTLFDARQMAELIEAMTGIGLVVVDEAYQPFALESFMPQLPHWPHLVVMRTVSKIGLAGIRLGYMSAAPALLAELDKVRPPYNVNVLTQEAALFALDHIEVFDAQAALLRADRSKLAEQLATLAGVEVFPSAGNFLLIRVPDVDAVCAKLLERQILVKNFGKMHSLLVNCLRVTVSTPHENALFVAALREALAV